MISVIEAEVISSTYHSKQYHVSTARLYGTTESLGPMLV